MININRLNQNNEYSLGTPNIQTKRSTLKMRETIQSTGMVGKIIPLTIHEVLPSETTRANTQINMEFTPFVTNIIHEINGEISNWFVPYRIIWDKWEEFITGCNEDEDIFDGSSNPPLPKIEPNKIIEQIRKNYIHLNELDNETKESRITIEAEKANAIVQDTAKRLNVNGISDVTDYFTGAIKLAIDDDFDESYILRPVTQLPPVTETGKKINKVISVGILYLARESLYDYYGLPSQFNWMGLQINWMYENQDMAVKYWNGSGISSTTNFLLINVLNLSEDSREENKIVNLNFMAYNKIYNDWERLLDWEPRRDMNDLSVAYGKYAWDIFTKARRYQLRGAMPTVPVDISGTIANGTIVSNVIGDTTSQEYIQIHDETGAVRIRSASQNGTPNGNVTINKELQGEMTGQGTWNILDMLTPSGLLNYYMANAKIKPRYANQLLARWGVNIQDERFQYAQYLGGNHITITQNGVTQTAPQVGDSTTQGNITGQAWGEGGADIDFYAPEHGVIIQLLTVKPSNAYEMGLESMYTKETRFDFPTPELVDTPDVQIKKTELAPYEPEDAVLGYKAIYDEYRTKFNKVTGLLRPSLYGSLAFKTLARQFDTITMEQLVRIEDRPFDRIKQFTEQPDFIFIKETNFANSIPLPYVNDPRIFI